MCPSIRNKGVLLDFDKKEVQLTLDISNTDISKYHLKSKNIHLVKKIGIFIFISALFISNY